MACRAQELLYCNQRSDHPSDHPDSGHVSLVFEHTDDTVLHFTRAIVGSGNDEKKVYSSRYSIGKETVSAEIFTKRLLALGINVKARNFLVFQVRSVSPYSASNMGTCSAF
jgi:chromosome segregation ATPase